MMTTTVQYYDKRSTMHQDSIGLDRVKSRSSRESEKQATNCHNRGPRSGPCQRRDTACRVPTEGIALLQLAMTT
jgi:hypothetical protein